MTSKRRREHPLKHAPPAAPGRSREDTYAWADELLRQLATCAGDGPAVDLVLARWLNESDDTEQFSLLVLAALRETFAACLTPTEHDQIPAGGVVFRATPTPTKETA